MKKAFNTLVKEQHNLLFSMVHKTNASNIEIMIKMNIINFGRVMTFLTYICYMFKQKKISRQQLINETEK